MVRTMSPPPCAAWYAALPEFLDVITMASKYLRTANLVKLGMSYPQNKLSLNRMARATHQTNLNHCWIVIYIECMRMGNLVWTTQQLIYIPFGFLTPFFWHERSIGTLRHEMGGHKIVYWQQQSGILNNQKSVQFRPIFCINQNDQSISQMIHFIFSRTQIYKNLLNG